MAVGDGAESWRGGPDGPGSRPELSGGYLREKAEEPPGKCPPGSPSLGKSQAQRFGALLTPSGAFSLVLSELELRDGKALMGSRVGTEEGRVATASEASEALELEEFRNPC